MTSQHTATVLPFRGTARRTSGETVAHDVDERDRMAARRETGNVVEFALFASRARRRRQAFVMAPYPGGEAA